MKKFSELESLYPRPAGYDGQSNGLPDGESIQKKLEAIGVAEAYKVPWDSYGHLSDATEDVASSVWGMGDGRKTLSQTGIPSIKKK